MRILIKLTLTSAILFSPCSEANSSHSFQASQDRTLANIDFNSVPFDPRWPRWEKVEDEDHAIFEFNDRESNPITVGHLISVESKAILVKDGNGKLHEIQIKNLSKPSQQIVDVFKRREKKLSKNAEEASKLFKKLKTKSDKLKIKYLEQLCALKSIASVYEREIAELAAVNKNDVGTSAFITFLSICSNKSESFQLMLEIIKSNNVIRFYLRDKPEFFFQLLIKFGELAEDTLIFAAYNGSIQLSNIDPKLLVVPQVFLTTDGSKNHIRASACYSLAMMPRLGAHDAMFKTIAAAERKINGVADNATIKSCFLGCANRGWKITSQNRYMSFHKKYEKTYKKEADFWFANQKKNLVRRFEFERLQRASKMKNFVDSKERFLVRAEVEKIENGKVLLTNHEGDRVTIPLANFSDDGVLFLKRKHIK